MFEEGSMSLLNKKHLSKKEQEDLKRKVCFIYLLIIHFHVKLFIARRTGCG
jgi:hypothetical protein